MRADCHPQDGSAAALTTAVLVVNWKNWVGAWFEFLGDFLTQQAKLQTAFAAAKKRGSKGYRLVDDLLGEAHSFVADQKGLAAEWLSQRVVKYAVNDFLGTELAGVDDDTQRELFSSLEGAATQLTRQSRGAIAMVNQTRVDLDDKITKVGGVDAGVLEEIRGLHAEVLARASQVDTQFTAINAVKADLDGRLTQFDSQFQTFTAQFTDFGQRYNTFTSNVSTFNQNLGTFNADYGKFNTDYADFRTRSDTIGGRLNTFDQNFATFNQSLTGFNQNLAGFNQNLTGFNQNLGKFNTDLGTSPDPARADDAGPEHGEGGLEHREDRPERRQDRPCDHAGGCGDGEDGGWGGQDRRRLGQNRTGDSQDGRGDGQDRSDRGQDRRQQAQHPEHPRPTEAERNRLTWRTSSPTPIARLRTSCRRADAQSQHSASDRWRDAVSLHYLRAHADGRALPARRAGAGEQAASALRTDDRAGH